VDFNFINIITNLVYLLSYPSYFKIKLQTYLRRHYQESNLIKCKHIYEGMIF